MTRSDLPTQAPVVIVGAGFAGLCAAIKLRDAGHRVMVIEKGDDVGGTWRVNTYPGCACDVPSLVYSYSFAQKPDWQSAYSPQPQIFEYLRGIARDYDLLPLIRFGVELRSATWHSDTQTWHLVTNAGDLDCRVLIAATGGLSEPGIPDIKNAASFEGPSWHSAEWRHDVDLEGKRVGVVGTGASAIQFVPHVQQAAARLTLFQRTPTWIMPRRDRSFSAREKQLNRLVPGLQKTRRMAIYLALESRIIGFAHRPGLLKLGEKIALKHLEKQVSDPALRAKLMPTFTMGCKRVLMSNTFYPAVAADNVEVVTERIVEMTPAGVVTESADGTRNEHRLDAVIWGTGFKITDPPIASRVVGPQGHTLAEHWSDSGMQALRGTAISGFPNFFILVGPNTGLGHNSIVLMIEAQVAYLVGLLAAAGGPASCDAPTTTTLDVKPLAQEAFNASLQRDLSHTVWNTGGCMSWYLDRHGRNTTLWSGSTIRYIREMRTAGIEEYDVTPIGTTAAATSGADNATVSA